MTEGSIPWKGPKTWKRLLVQVVREPTAVSEPPPSLREPAILARFLLGSGILNQAVEQLWVCVVDARLRFQGAALIGQGSEDSAPVNVQAVLRSVLLTPHSRFILVHNHPSGDVSPSREDSALTERVRQASELVGLECLDHIIVGHGRFYYSFAEGRTMSHG